MLAAINAALLILTNLCALVCVAVNFFVFYFPVGDNTESKTAIYGAIGANIVIAISKSVAAYFTSSSAILSEGIHSLVDSSNGVGGKSY